MPASPSRRVDVAGAEAGDLRRRRSRRRRCGRPRACSGSSASSGPPGSPRDRASRTAAGRRRPESPIRCRDSAGRPGWPRTRSSARGRLRRRTVPWQRSWPIVGEAHATALRNGRALLVSSPPMETAGGTTVTEHFDVLIVGAGLSGIGAACRLQTRCPDRSFAILEGRDRSGGTWDLFRYPGVRSDSDMFTLGYPFRPWTGAKAIADGPAILAYLRDTAREFGIDRQIRFGHRVVRADWSSERAAWTVEVERDGRPRSRCASAAACSSCAAATTATPRATRPRFPARESFAGTDRPSAAVARRHRRRRQARRRHRQRRDRGDPGAGAGAERRPGDDAAALADLDGRRVRREDRLAKRLRRVLPLGARERRDALAAGAPRHVLLRPLPAQSGAREAPAARRRARLDGPGARARAALHAALRPVATAPLPGARRRPVPRPAQRPRARSPPARSSASRRPACAWSAARSLRPT